MTQDLTSYSELAKSVPVSVDPQELTGHAYDWWPVAAKWRGQGKIPFRPDAVARPAETKQVSEVLQWASAHRIPVTPWGAGSGVTGAALATRGGICLDMSSMNRVLMLDETNLLVTVQAGMMGHVLENDLQARGYTLNHSPQSLDRSSVGGWLATRAVGQFSSKWGGIEDLVVGFKAVLPTGEIVANKLAPRSATGPDWRHIFIGAEGTMGVICEVTLKIFPRPAARLYQAIEFPSVQAGVETMRHIMRVGLRPFLVRFYDADEAPFVMKDSSYHRCLMFLGTEGLETIAEVELQESLRICRSLGGASIGPEPVVAWMQRRFDFSTVDTILTTAGGVAETIEIAHFWDSILPTYLALKENLSPLADDVLGHFSHVYPQGTSLYMILLGQAKTEAEAEDRILSIWETAMRTSLEQGATISHHHGVGLARAPYVHEELSSGALVLTRVKAALDPYQIMNPGKLGLR